MSESTCSSCCESSIFDAKSGSFAHNSGGIGCTSWCSGAVGVKYDDGTTGCGVGGVALDSNESPKFPLFTGMSGGCCGVCWFGGGCDGCTIGCCS